jgi:hypothetical protein
MKQLIVLRMGGSSKTDLIVTSCRLFMMTGGAAFPYHVHDEMIFTFIIMFEAIRAPAVTKSSMKES